MAPQLQCVSGQGSKPNKGSIHQCSQLQLWYGQIRQIERESAFWMYVLQLLQDH